MKLSENTKITITIGQLKKLVNEGIPSAVLMQATAAAVRSYITGGANTKSYNHIESDDNMYGAHVSFDRVNGDGVEGYIKLNQNMARSIGSLGLEGNAIQIDTDGHAFMSFDAGDGEFLKQIGLGKYIGDLKSGQACIMQDEGGEWIFSSPSLGDDVLKIADVQRKLGSVAGYKARQIFSNLGRAIRNVTTDAMGDGDRAQAVAGAVGAMKDVAAATASKSAQMASLAAQYAAAK